MTFKAKTILRKVVFYFHYSYLLVRNFIFSKKLNLINFSYVNNLATQGNEVEILWDVSGCHKIVIKELYTLPGTTSGIRLIFQFQPKLIEITFYGIGGQQTIKEVFLEVNKITLPNKFTPFIKVPKLCSIAFNQKKIKSVFAYSFDIRNKANISTNIHPPKLKSFDLKIHHIPFIKSNYPT